MLSPKLRAHALRRERYLTRGANSLGPCYDASWHFTLNLWDKNLKLNLREAALRTDHLVTQGQLPFR
ncbi:MAG: hypothetical protein L0338_33975, partial [Acidobacteria bacterium]|nr:hypothetical protein [Acidobacteriota bacterium]